MDEEKDKEKLEEGIPLTPEDEFWLRKMLDMTAEIHKIG
jgi:gluconate kinase